MNNEIKKLDVLLAVIMVAIGIFITVQVIVDIKLLGLIR